MVFSSAPLCKSQTDDVDLSTLWLLMFLTASTSFTSHHALLIWRLQFMSFLIRDAWLSLTRISAPNTAWQHWYQSIFKVWSSALTGSVAPKLCWDLFSKTWQNNYGSNQVLWEASCRSNNTQEFQFSFIMMGFIFSSTSSMSLEMVMSSCWLVCRSAASVQDEMLRQLLDQLLWTFCRDTHVSQRTNFYFGNPLIFPLGSLWASYLC